MRVGKTSGFTIVELLIVVVVIAILAAITIVAFNGINDRARTSAATSLASQVQRKVALYAVENNGQYPASLDAAGVDAATATSVQYSVNNSTNPAGYCLTATQNTVSAFAAEQFSYTGSSSTTLNQASPAAGACPGHAAAGGVALVSLTSNPALRLGGANWNALSSASGSPSGARVTLVSGLESLGITTAYRNTLGGTPANWWRVQHSTNNALVEPGRTYTMSGYVRPSINANTGAIIIWINASGNNIGESAGSSFSNQTGMTWERKVVTATAPAGAVYARFQFGASNNGASGRFIDATAVMFHEGSTAYAYSDGDSAGWVWDGAANASTSRGPGL